MTNAPAKTQANGIPEEIRKFLMKDRPAGVTAIHYEDDLFEKGFMDSLQIVSLVAFVEQQYQVSLDFEDLIEDNLRSVNAVSRLIRKKKG